MRDVHRAARLAADAQRLLDGVEQVLALVAHVGSVDAAVGGDALAQLDDLFSDAPAAGLVDQAGREAAGPLRHRLAHPILHLTQLGLGELALLVTRGAVPERVVTHQGDAVDRRPARLYPPHVAGEVRPVDRRIADTEDGGVLD